MDPKAAGISALISSHSHKPSLSEKNTIAYLNPGSAGPRRFSLPVTLIRASLINGTIFPRLIAIEF